jgi:hypothetical protein
MKLKSKKGKTFGLLTVIKRDRKRMDRVYWICKCSCGVIKSVRGDKLGTTTVSCGHYNRELIRKAQEGADSMFKTNKHRLFYYIVLKPLHDHIRSRDGNKCVLCGTKKNLHVHHILRKSKYRSYLLEPCNLITLCETCHFFDAHSGNTNTVNLELADSLLRIAFINERVCPTPEDLIKIVIDKAKPFLGD